MSSNFEGLIKPRESPDRSRCSWSYCPIVAKTATSDGSDCVTRFFFGAVCAAFALPTPIASAMADLDADPLAFRPRGSRIFFPSGTDEITSDRLAYPIHFAKRSRTLPANACGKPSSVCEQGLRRRRPPPRLLRHRPMIRRFRPQLPSVFRRPVSLHPPSLQKLDYVLQFYRLPSG
jgi:hypothetical protein